MLQGVIPEYRISLLTCSEVFARILVRHEAATVWQQLLILILIILAIPLVSRDAINRVLRQIFGFNLRLVTVLQHALPLLVMINL